PHALVVTTWPKLIKNRTTVSERLTDASDIKSPQYDYRLYVDPAEEDRLVVVFGEWINQSRIDHPDIILIPKKGEVRPKNEELNRNLAVLDLIMQEAQK